MFIGGAMKSIWTMGEMIVEIMRPRAGMPHDEAGEYIGPFPSGAPTIMISAAARLGAMTGIIGGVGKDAFGDLILRRLNSYGVDCECVKRSDNGSTGNAFVMYHGDGAREFVFHIDGTPAVQAEVPPVEKLSNVGFFHIMGCSLTVSREYCEKIIRTAELARTCGGKITFDPNIRTELLGDGNLQEIIRPIINNCSILLPGVDELLMISGKSNVTEAVEELFQSAALEIIALKNGSKGCRIYTRDGVLEVPAFPVEQKDATGAGDCFDGAFLAAVLQGKNLRRAALEANAAGALNAAAFGPMEGDITPDHVSEFINGIN